MSLSRKVVSPNLPLIYRRTMGGVQLLCSALFGWPAFLSLRWTTEQMTRVAQKGFDFQGETFKGAYSPALDLGKLAEGTVLALLSLCCLIGGVGLLRLRSWASRWEVAYLLVVSAYALWVITVEVKRGHDFEYLVLFSTALILPYLPLALITSSPGKVPSA